MEIGVYSYATYRVHCSHLFQQNSEVCRDSANQLDCRHGRRIVSNASRWSPFARKIKGCVSNHPRRLVKVPVDGSSDRASSGSAAIPLPSQR